MDDVLSARTAVVRAHVPELDGLRGIAILAVMSFHFAAISSVPVTSATRVYRAMAQFGYTGVDLFFVLSGFLITGILVDERGSPTFYRAFIARRALRILPVYCVYLLVVLAWRPSVLGLPAPPARMVPWLLAFGTNIVVASRGWLALPAATAHLWTLAVEEQFYLTWPFVVAMLPFRRLAYACAALAVLAFALRLAALTIGVDPVAIYTLTPLRFDTLALGSLCALVVRDPVLYSRIRPWVGRVLMASAVVIASVALVNRSEYGVPMQLVGYSALATGSAALVLYVVQPHENGTLSRLLRSPPLTMFGRYSYVLYLVHGVVGAAIVMAGVSASVLASAFASPLLGMMTFAVAAGSASLAVALLSWFLLERPILSLKRYVPYGRPAARTSA